METQGRKARILVCCTGSVATMKLCELVDTFLKHGVDVRIVVTKHAQHFYDSKDLPAHVEVFRDENEWTTWTKRGDPVLHIELSKWADVLLLAPLDANSLAKVAQGLCDNLLTCVVRAWDVKKPLLFCPAMNTYMWYHPVTATHVVALRNWGYIEVPCISKTLMCGDTGLGAMAEVNTIVNTTMSIISNLKL